MLGTLLTVIVRYFAIFTFFLYSLDTQWKNFWDIRILKKHEKIYSTNVREELPSAERIAIVALFPRSGLYASTERLVTALQRNGFEVLLVVNNNSLANRWIQRLEPLGVSSILRPNIGRDFGSFQSGVAFLQSAKALRSCKTLVLANDSIYYTPNSHRFVDELFALPGAWKAMFINFVSGLHAQSFFLVLESPVFNDARFLLFWKTYYPSDLRHRAINNGEKRLSQELMKSGYTPIALVNAERLLNAKRKPQFEPGEIFPMLLENRTPLVDLTEIDPKVIEYLISANLVESNPTHTLGLLATRALGAPLKLDLFKFGRATLESLRLTLLSAGIDEEEYRDLETLFVINGSIKTPSGFFRLWRKFGYF